LRFFSKITVICNICFLAAVVFWYIEMHKQSGADSSQVLPLPWLEGSLVILGYLAIIINTLFLLLAFVFYSLKTNISIPRWMIIFNIIIFCCQVYFHFILKD